MEGRLTKIEEKSSAVASDKSHVVKRTKDQAAKLFPAEPKPFKRSTTPVTLSPKTPDPIPALLDEDEHREMIQKVKSLAFVEPDSSATETQIDRNTKIQARNIAKELYAKFPYEAVIAFLKQNPTEEQMITAAETGQLPESVSSSKDTTTLYDPSSASE